MGMGWLVEDSGQKGSTFGDDWWVE